MDFFAALFVLGAVLQTFLNSDYRKNLLRPTGFEWMAALWFTFTAFSLFINRDLVPESQWQKLLDFRWLLLAVLIGRHLSFAKIQLRTLNWHLVVFSIGSLWAVMIFFLKTDPLAGGQAMDMFPDGTVRTGGFHRQAIVFAQLYGLWLMLPFGILLAEFPKFQILRRSPVHFVHLVDAVVWGCLAILLSFTRGIWLAIPISLFVLLFFRKWWWAAIGGVLAGTSILGLMQVWPALESRILQAAQGGDSERLWIWTANFRMFLDSPIFGVGYNQNVQLLPKYYEIVGAPGGLLESHAHNQYLQILVGLGIAGFLFYLGFWILCFKRAVDFAFRFEKGSLAQGLAFGLMGALLVFFFGGLFESNFEHSKIRYTLALMLGLLLWLGDQESNSSQVSLRRDTQ